MKFDFEINKVMGGTDSVGLFCFELTTPFPVGATTVCVFGGGVTSSALAICGRVCPAAGGCTVTASQLANVCVPVRVRPFARVGPTRTICCGSPSVVSGETCRGEPGGSCPFTVSQLICVEVPVTFRARATNGETHVLCGTPAPGECVCLPNNDSGGE